MVADVPNAFVQTPVTKERLKKGERIIMKIRGVLVDMLVQMNRELYEPFVTTDAKGNKLLYVIMLKALYGMLIASLDELDRVNDEMAVTLIPAIVLVSIYIVPLIRIVWISNLYR